MSTEFQISNTLYGICWLLAAVVIGFDIFLFTTYLHAIPSVWLAIALGITYLVRYTLTINFSMTRVSL